MQSVSFLAQLIGPCLLVVSVSMLARREAMIPLVENLMQNPPLLFVMTEPTEMPVPGRGHIADMRIC